MAIRCNIVGSAADPIQGSMTAMELWDTLKVIYKGKGVMLIDQALDFIMDLCCQSVAYIDKYIQKFQKYIM
jgi:hypothetical protein